MLWNHNAAAELTFTVKLPALSVKPLAGVNWKVKWSSERVVENPFTTTVRLVAVAEAMLAVKIVGAEDGTVSDRVTGLVGVMLVPLLVPTVNDGVT